VSFSGATVEEIGSYSGYDCTLTNPSQAICVPTGDATGTVWFRLVYPQAGRIAVTATASVAGDVTPGDDTFTLPIDAP
jgi:hypothetical protein